MTTERRFAMLASEDVTRLMKLAMEAGLCTAEFSPMVRSAYGALAAELAFELWSRERLRLQARRTCGRPIGPERLALHARQH